MALYCWKDRLGNLGHGALACCRALVTVSLRALAILWSNLWAVASVAEMVSMHFFNYLIY